MSANTYLVIAVFVNTGIGKGSGKPFEMQRVAVLDVREDVNTPTFQSTGVGLACIELSVSPAFFTALHNQFLKDFKGLPVSYSLNTSLDRDGRNRVVGFGDVENISASPEPQAAPEAQKPEETAAPLFRNRGNAAS